MVFYFPNRQQILVFKVAFRQVAERQTESLAMPDAVPTSSRVQNLKVCGHVNMVSRGSCLYHIYSNDTTRS